MEKVSLPVLADMYPSWFDIVHGPKLMVDKSALGTGTFRLFASAASVEIIPLMEGKWQLNWKVIYSQDKEWTEGQLILNTDVLESMFGLKPGTERQYESWKCVRVGRCLNIPDKHSPSISIYLDSQDTIRNTLLEFIQDNT